MIRLRLMTFLSAAILAGCSKQDAPAKPADDKPILISEGACIGYPPEVELRKAAATGNVTAMNRLSVWIIMCGSENPEDIFPWALAVAQKTDDPDMINTFMRVLLSKGGFQGEKVSRAWIIYEHEMLKKTGRKVAQETRQYNIDVLNDLLADQTPVVAWAPPPETVMPSRR